MEEVGGASQLKKARKRKRQRIIERGCWRTVISEVKKQKRVPDVASQLEKNAFEEITAQKKQKGRERGIIWRGG